MQPTKWPPKFKESVEEEPRWQAILALIAVGGLYLALPRALTIGPRWMLITIVCALLVPAIVSYRMRYHEINYVLGHIANGIVTLYLVFSLYILVHALPTHAEAPGTLLRSAVALWLTNVLVFALWYWRLDAGGPHARSITPGHTDGAFLFPQMVMSQQAKEQAGEVTWSPHFLDYLFLAFNTSTALSPTDTAVLARWAKLLTMLQSLISLTVVALLAARAVNIL